MGLEDTPRLLPAQNSHNFFSTSQTLISQREGHVNQNPPREHPPRGVRAINACLPRAYAFKTKNGQTARNKKRNEASKQSKRTGLETAGSSNSKTSLFHEAAVLLYFFSPQNIRPLCRASFPRATLLATEAPSLSKTNKGHMSRPRTATELSRARPETSSGGTRKKRGPSLCSPALPQIGVQASTPILFYHAAGMTTKAQRCHTFIAPTPGSDDAPPYSRLSTNHDPPRKRKRAQPDLKTDEPTLGVGD